MQVRGDRFTATVEALPEGHRRDAYHAQFKEMTDAVEDYEGKTDRTFPAFAAPSPVGLVPSRSCRQASGRTEGWAPGPGIR